MQIVVIGASGLIGSRLADRLQQQGHTVVRASPTHGVDTVTGRGLERALQDAEVVVDVSNSPSMLGTAPICFFAASGRTLVAAELAAGVRRHVCLSVIGTDGLQSGSYFGAKKIQEDLVRGSGLPFTILRSTQSFELIAGVVQGDTQDEVALAPSLVQPVAASEVAETLADLATGEPLNGVIEVAGPEQFRLTDLGAEVLTAYEDDRRIIADPHARYCGVELTERSLLPGPGARIGQLRFQDWLRRSLQTNHSGR